MPGEVAYEDTADHLLGGHSAGRTVGTSQRLVAQPSDQLGSARSIISDQVHGLRLVGPRVDGCVPGVGCVNVECHGLLAGGAPAGYLGDGWDHLTHVMRDHADRSVLVCASDDLRVVDGSRMPFVGTEAGDVVRKFRSGALDLVRQLRCSGHRGNSPTPASERPAASTATGPGGKVSLECL